MKSPNVNGHEATELAQWFECARSVVHSASPFLTSVLYHVDRFTFKTVALKKLICSFLWTATIISRIC